ncbi:sensor histidine kinase [Marinomonas mediterranea]|uniref:histidine kinase n=1 Tax=Marinomonas mediterranea (strain ATCC 700492 / JCM 21426 / NBRC 103028 / MMB-1) TaxID=717774 RepID=F2K3L8_MARM1|nr:ATP-binding protein [Marinomonas mediterranea]ADZ92457.1 PAS/PAC sensor signal transduction histidine kinase [Marinomonas mediterranea MMB-1]WCN18505.1 PAS domain-containing protein [Marinomonas mediterranea MMB-1]
MTKDEEITQLKEAFESFKETSEVLSQSYADLQGQVAILSERLAQSERAKIEQESQNNQLIKQFHQLFLSMPVGVLLINAEGRIVMTNPIVERLLEVTLLGESWSSIVPKCFSPQEDDGHEVTLVSGRRVRVETSSLGDVPGQLIILVDLTETHLLQKKLSHHERLSNIGRMVAALAHQIRTPLSSAMLYAGHLQKDDIPDDLRKKFTGKLSERLKNIERQIRDMLIFSKSDIKLDEAVPIEEFYNALTALTSEVSEQANHNVAVHLDVNDASNQFIRCNRDTLIGAITNLVSNAIEASVSTASPVELVLEVVDDNLVVRVQDSGIGMSPQKLKEIDEGFVTTKQHGTGLGMMVVKAIVRAHHGVFRLISEEGKGTCAYVYIPLLRS